MPIRQQKITLRPLELYAAIIDRYDQLIPCRQLAVLRGAVLFRQRRLWAYRVESRPCEYRVIGGVQ